MSHDEILDLRPPKTHVGIFVAFALVTLIGALIPGAAREAQLAFFTATLGLLALLSPGKRVATPLLLGAAACVALSFASFLPASWFPTPAWRSELEAAGVDTGSRVVIQAHHALEQYFPVILLVAAALWFTSHRLGSRHLIAISLILPAGVALQILLYHLVSDQLPGHLSSPNHFGFFPNRNHSATLFSMAAIASLGAAFQSLREKRSGLFVFSAALTLLILWTLFSHSISRGGLVLTGIGFTLWVALTGWKHFGKNEARVFGLLLLFVSGIYFIGESRSKNRLDSTLERLAEPTPSSLVAEDEREEAPVPTPLDFRVPIMQDTLGMIRDAPLTGIGAGQFRYLFPQYRDASLLASSAIAMHPESDWLMMAAEFGIPAAVGFAALVALAFTRSALRIRKTRDRALRAACLVAAALLPIHGFFDAPGHRPALVLIAILLFALANPPRQTLDPPPSRQIFPRAFALLLALGGLYLTGHLPLLSRHPDLGLDARARSAYQSASRDYQEILRPAAGSSLFRQQDQRLRLAAAARHWSDTMPLDPRWRRLEAVALLPILPERPAVERAFLIERELSPDRIQPLLQQARAWSGYDPAQSPLLWHQALELAHRIDRLPNQKGRATQAVESSVRTLARNHPPIRDLAEPFLLKN